MNALPTLIRREFWEHRALWIVPLVCSGIVVLLGLSGRVLHYLPNDVEKEILSNPEIIANEQYKLAGFALVQWLFAWTQLFVMAIVLFFYLIDALYAERRDRSILFWKSLPVSDSATVVAKLLVAAAIVPLGVYLVAVVTDALFAGIFSLTASASPLAQLAIGWDMEVWLRVQWLVLLGLLAAVLWYAPVAGYLLLVSAWARRNVFLWAVLPPVILLLAEEIAFDTDFVKALLGHRLSGPWDHIGTDQRMDDIAQSIGTEGGVRVVDLLAAVDASPLFTSPGLWLGLAAAGVFVWGAIRIRRYRDDT
jgi:ABC-2 type transport system permease protein